MDMNILNNLNYIIESELELKQLENGEKYKTLLLIGKLYYKEMSENFINEQQVLPTELIRLDENIKKLNNIIYINNENDISYTDELEQQVHKK